MRLFCFPWMIALGAGTLTCRKAGDPEGITSTGFQICAVPTSRLPLGRVTSLPLSPCLQKGDHDNTAELIGVPRG